MTLPRLRPNPRRLLACALLCSLALPLVAHDIYLDADRFRLEPNDTLVVRQLVGAELARSKETRELPVLRDMTTGFTLTTATGTVDLISALPDIRTRPNVQPVLERAVEFSGAAVVGMEHAVLYTEHSDEEFFDYLAHEGFDRADFEGGMTEGGFQPEGYQRSMKALLWAEVDATENGDTSPSDVHATVLGHEIEIVPRQNPYRLDPGDTLEIQILLRGAPLGGQRVHAYRSGSEGPVTSQTASTDEAGVARLELDRAGRWLIRLVHLGRCAEESPIDCADATWESYWAALSFELD